MRNTWRTRFWLRRVLRRSTLLELVSLSGHRQIQEPKWWLFLKALKSLPSSVMRVMALITPMDGMSVRSTPKKRCNSSRHGPSGSFLLVFLRGLAGRTAAAGVVFGGAGPLFNAEY